MRTAARTTARTTAHLATMALLLGVTTMMACDDDPEAADDGPRAYQPVEGTNTLEAGGVEFAYFEEGEGPLVVLLHGFPDTAQTWDDVRPALAAAGYRAVSPFMRGYAPSGIPADGRYDAEALGRDVIAIIEALGEEQAIVVGHDWGASAAYAAASIAPERVSKLVTVAIPHPASIALDPSLLANAEHFTYLAQPDAEALMRDDDFAHVDTLYARWSPTWEVPADETEAVKNSFTAPGSLDAALGYYRALADPPPEFFMQPIMVPTLTFAGVDDGVTPPEAFDTVGFMFAAGYTVERVAGGHFLHRESPAEFEAALLAFLAE